MIAIEIVVLELRKGDEAGKYTVELTIDGGHEVFVVGTVPTVDGVLIFERKFQQKFANLIGVDRIANLVLDFHKGIAVVMPVAFQVFRLERGDEPPRRQWRK